jgi:uncharacterized membrane protein
MRTTIGIVIGDRGSIDRTFVENFITGKVTTIKNSFCCTSLRATRNATYDIASLILLALLGPWRL